MEPTRREFLVLGAYGLGLLALGGASVSSAQVRLGSKEQTFPEAQVGPNEEVMGLARRGEYPAQALQRLRREQYLRVGGPTPRIVGVWREPFPRNTWVVFRATQSGFFTAHAVTGYFPLQRIGVSSELT